MDAGRHLFGQLTLGHWLDTLGPLSARRGGSGFIKPEYVSDGYLAASIDRFRVSLSPQGLLN